MEFQQNSTLREGFLGSLSEGPRNKSSLRMKYEAERVVLRQKLGSLDEIRQQLGLTQRKMTQLLLVDPSAWTRWLKDESRVPPHIYRSLQWYLELIDKKPEWSPHNSFQPYIQTQNPKWDKQWTEVQIQLDRATNRMQSQSAQFEQILSESRAEWIREKAELEEKIEKKDVSLTIWKLIVLLHTVTFLFALVWWFL